MEELYNTILQRIHLPSAHDSTLQAELQSPQNIEAVKPQQHTESEKQILQQPENSLITNPKRIRKRKSPPTRIPLEPEVFLPIKNIPEPLTEKELLINNEYEIRLHNLQVINNFGDK